MMRRYVWFPLLFLLIASLLTTGCRRRPAGTEGVSRPGQPAAGTPAQPRDGGSLNFGLWDTPAGVFNPLFATNPADQEINGLLFETLLRFGPDLSPQPNLARRFTVSRDQKTITFDLRDGLRWHDGRPVTAEDVAFTVRLALNPDYRGPYRDQFLAIKGAGQYRARKAEGVDGIRIDGPNTVSFTLESPYGPVLTRLGALPILPRHAFLGMPVKAMAGAPATRRTPVGSGPFRLVSFTPRPMGVVAELARFDGFFRGRPHLDKVAFAVVGPRLTVERLRSGGIDLLRLHPNAARPVQGVGRYVLHEAPAGGYYYLGVNLQYAPLDDRRLRQAIAHALDRRDMVRGVFAGHGTLVNGPVFPGSWAEVPGLNPYGFDPGKARRLLAEAGFADSDGDGLVDRGGKDLALNLFYRKGRAVDGQVAAMIRRSLQGVGIRVYLRPMEEKDLLDRVFRRRKFDLYLLDWRMGADPDTREVFGEQAVGNAVGFRRGQDLLAQGAVRVSLDQRRPVYRSWARLANEELPYIFLFTENKILASDRRVRDLSFTPLGMPDTPERWWVER